MIRSRFLYLLIIADFIFIILNTLFILNILLDESFSMEKDRSYSEFFQYTKEFAIIVLFLTDAQRNKRFLSLVWAGLFLFFLIDDSILIRERFSHSLVKRLKFEYAYGLRPEDFGEGLIILMVGFIFVVMFMIGFSSSDSEERVLFKKILGLIFILMLFGVVLDFVNVAFFMNDFKGIMGTIEEGGEMITMSLILFFIYQNFWISKKNLV